jgi:hypothetical protein
MNATFWKTDPIPDEGIMVSCLMPLGTPKAVASVLLRMPKARPWFDETVMRGLVTIMWDVGDGVCLRFREEPEFAPGNVFSIMVNGHAPRADFFVLYERVYGVFGAVLLEGRSFVTVRQFEKTI